LRFIFINNWISSWFAKVIVSGPDVIIETFVLDVDEGLFNKASADDKGSEAEGFCIDSSFKLEDSDDWREEDEHIFNSKTYISIISLL